jgi:hypothetical protein
MFNKKNKWICYVCISILLFIVITYIYKRLNIIENINDNITISYKNNIITTKSSNNENLLPKTFNLTTVPYTKLPIYVKDYVKKKVKEIRDISMIEYNGSLLRYNAPYIYYLNNNATLPVAKKEVDRKTFPSITNLPDYVIDYLIEKMWNGKRNYIELDDGVSAIQNIYDLTNTKYVYLSSDVKNVVIKTQLFKNIPLEDYRNNLIYYNYPDLYYTREKSTLPLIHVVLPPYYSDLTINSDVLFNIKKSTPYFRELPGYVQAYLRENVWNKTQTNIDKMVIATQHIKHTKDPNYYKQY